MIFFIMIEELEAVKEGWSDVDLVDIDKDAIQEGMYCPSFSKNRFCCFG